ncbi:MAG: DNA ligase [Campylobacterota bacterium]|nr:DNA ligase [Campylobacterota bacterium]
MKLIIYLIVFSIFLWADKPKLMLLKTYKDQNITGWVMSEKLDGIRAYWDGIRLVSRGGKIIHAPKWFTKDYPPFELDGELWTKRNDFENISSIVRDKTPNEKEWEQIKHYIFEVPSTKGNLQKRLEKVKPFLSSTLKLLKQIPIKDKRHLDKYLNEIENKKGEGLVVRDPNVPYINKRTSKALKVKTFQDAECEVVGYTKGKGKYKDVVGAIECQLENGVIFKIGTGLSNKERHAPPSIGEMITFQYQRFTKYEKPRFPVFLRVRKK